MLVSLKEVSKYVDISSLTPEEIAQRLTFSGIEVEEIKHLSEATNLVIGEVLTCVAHPDSDHLHCCKVNIGTEILDIVCGAPNCRAGLKVIVAKAGAKLPHGEIKKGMIRGQESNGMLCALNELGVDPKYLKEEQIKGIEELPSDAKVGETNVLEYLGLDDTILDLNLLANRSDCYSLYNVAKEIGALFNRKVTMPEEKDLGTFDADFKVGSLTEKCKQFSSKVIKGIKIKESPKFLKEVLRSQGIRSIDNIVDIGNYAMLLTGQPIHMYDYDKLMKNELIVKDDYEGEVVALDDKSYQIQKGDLVVTSDGEAVAIAGVMGLANVEIDENTKNIVVEVANFDHASIRRTSSRLGLTSDSSQRFVKGINPNQYNDVLYLVARLCKEYADAQEVSKNINYDTLNHDKKVIKSSYKYINNRLGTNFANEVIKNTLTSLHFDFIDLEDGEFEVTVPPYRIDVDKTKLVINESPLLLSVSYVTSNSVTLSFDSGESGDDICKLYRSTDKISYGYLVDIPCDGTYTDNNLSPNTTYYYKFDKGEIDSDVVSVTTLDYVESGDDNINEDVDDENNTDSEINVDTETDIDDEIENPSTGVFIPIILLLVLLGLGLLLFYYTKKKNIFNKI